MNIPSDWQGTPTPEQAALPLDAPPLSPGAPLIPARMVNEYVYRPRLAYLGTCLRLRVRGRRGEPGCARRRAYIAAFERRFAQEVAHPIFGYAAQYRHIIEIQCRLLGHHLLGEIDDYPNFITR